MESSKSDKKNPSRATSTKNSDTEFDGEKLALEDVKNIDSNILRRIAARFLSEEERAELNKHEVEVTHTSRQFPTRAGSAHTRTIGIMDHDKDPHDKDPHDKGTHGRENHSRENHSRA